MRTAVLVVCGHIAPALIGCFDPAEMARPSAVADPELVRLDDEPPGSNCAMGGIAKRTGADISGDGILQDDEIVATLYTCACSGSLDPAIAGAVPPVCEQSTRLSARFESDGDTLYTAIQGVRATLVALAPVPDAGRPLRRASLTDDECLLGLLPRSAVDSQHCLPCHIARAKEHGRPLNFQAHPIGIDYDDAVKRGRVSLHPVERLPLAVVLVDGRVECTTCHSEHTNLSSQVATRRLCFACHRL